MEVELEEKGGVGVTVEKTQKRFFGGALLLHTPWKNLSDAC